MVDAPKKPDLLNSLKDAKGAFDLFAEANEFRKSPKRVLDPDADIKFLKKLDKEKNNPVLRDAVSSAITEPLNKLPGGFRMGVAAKPLIDAVAPMINYFAQDMMSTAANVAPVIEEIFTAGPPRMETPAPVFEISAPVVEEPAFVPTPVLPPEPVVVTAPKVEAP